MREPIQKTVKTGDIELCYFEWGEPVPNVPSVLLVHATGFHARCWDQTVRYLGDAHVVAVDSRGHGRSSKLPPFSWDTFGDDLANVIEILHLDHLVGVGHSMGGHCLVQAAARHQARFEALVLVDPVILNPEVYRRYQPTEADTHPVSRRRNHFDSPASLRRQLEGRGGFANWLPEALDDYCEYGLLPDPEGEGLVLACPPAIEAAIYTGSAGTAIWDDVHAITCPVSILRAKALDPADAQMDFSKSPTWPSLVNEFANAIDEHHPELSHFIPMQAPTLVAKSILNYAAD